MSTELDVISERAAQVAAAPAGSAAAAIEMLRAHAQMMSMAYGLAEKMVKTSMVPSHFRLKPEDATAAILYGAELGLNPIQSLQQVFSVHGKPSLEARTMVALLKAKGYRIKTIENTDTRATLHGWEPGAAAEDDPEAVTWTIDDAYKAEFVPVRDEKTGAWKTNSNGKLAGNMKYLTQPRQMLWAKAAAELCRHLAPDVLLGIAYSREDLESEPAPDPVHVKSERVSVADVLGEQQSPPAAASGVPVQDWQPSPEAPADPDSQHHDHVHFVGPEAGAPSEPDDVQTAPSNDGAEPDTAQGDEAVDSKPEPAEPMSSAAQQRRINKLLGQLGAQDDNDRGIYLSRFFERDITHAKQLTAAEANEVITELTKPPTPDSVAEATDDGQQ